jgi:hypothetical protein
MLALHAPIAMALEEPDFEVLLETEDYEVRRYQSYIVAEVDLDGDFKAAGNDAFRILADYIFGNNEPGEKMKMTAPVESREGMRMNMTAPVTSTPADDDSRVTYAFVMERKYTMDSLPAPTDPRIRIVERPARIMAVRRYSGGWSEKRYRENETALLDALQADRIEATGIPVFARYNAPFTPWFLRRNEVMIEIDWTGQVQNH